MNPKTDLPIAGGIPSDSDPLAAELNDHVFDDNFRPAPIPLLRSIDTARLSRPVPPRLKPRGLPPALVRHEIFVTDAPSDASRLATNLLGSHRIEVQPGSTFRASLHAVRFHDITMAYLDLQANCRVVIDHLPDTYLVLIAMSGEASVENLGRHAVINPITGAVPAPGSAAVINWRSDAPQLIISIDGDALRAHLARLIGRRLAGPLVFDLELALGKDDANRWSAAIQLLHSELLHEESLLHRGAGTTALEEFVMSALLYVAHSNHSELLERPASSASRRVVRAASDFIEKNLAMPLTVAQIAAAANCSVRTLQAGFQTELRRSTWAYVQDRRLERVRADLLAARPDDETSVSAVAMRWGFNHLGRFASDYRERFGESPSATLSGRFEGSD